MKKIGIFIISVLLFFNISKAQEKVGINTLTPEETLHVIGDIILLESPNGSKKILLRTAGADGELKSLGDLYLRAQSNDIILNHVPSDGNVGIGTTTAPEKLTVEGAIQLATTTNMTSAGGTLKFESGDFLGYDGTTWKSLTGGGSGGVWTESGLNVYYLGSVGVNTTSPNADLHVVGDTLLLQSPDGTKYLLFRNAGADSEVKSIGDLYIRGQNSDVIINHVSTDGNVGIGTATPTEQLDINGAVRIGSTTTDNAGTIRFEGGEFEGYDGTEWKSLTSSGGVFENFNGLVRNTGNNATDDFIFGDDELPSNGAIISEAMFFFDESKAAFRAGRLYNSDVWGIDSLGLYSFASGYNTGAIGDRSFASGWRSVARGTSSAAFNSQTQANGAFSATFGHGTIAKSGHEFVIGKYNTDYEVAAPVNEDQNRVFVIGNGTSDTERHNALTVLKSGDFIINADKIPQEDFNSGKLAFFSAERAAFRAGEIGTSKNWNIDSVGYHSFAFGKNTKASNSYAFAGGLSSRAEGSYSLAFGFSCEAFGNYSTAIGFDSEADATGGVAIGRAAIVNGQYGTAFGHTTRANGYNSFAAGRVTFARSGYETVFGRYNTTSGIVHDADGWDEEDQLFVVGNGTSSSNQKDAFVIYKNGETYMADRGVNIRPEIGSTGAPSHGVIDMYNEDGNRTIKIDAQTSSSAYSQIYMYDGVNTTDPTIRINANWGGSGDSRIVVDELQIVGGSDLAEHFDILEETISPIPGMVVSIDPKSTGKLTITKEAYDKKVAGIISGANGVETGFFMGQSGTIADGEYPIALTGRVYVYANEEGGKIKPGDLLTTSSTYGYAMKVEDYQSAQGAIIGKAMTEIDKNGFVLVLVNLQ